MNGLVKNKTHFAVGVQIAHELNLRGASRFLDPEQALIVSEASAAFPHVKLDPMSDLDLAITNGWGDTPQPKLPPDWKTRKNV